MSATFATTTEEVVKQSKIGAGGGNGFKNNGGGNNGGRGPQPNPNPDKYKIAIWFVMGSVVMLFMAFTSVYLISKGRSDWKPIAAPSAIWFSTALLLISSVTIEIARVALRRGKAQGFKTWFYLTTGLGLGFLVGQIYSWQQLVDKKIYLNSNPHSSFFYVLTFVHAVHLIGGICAFAYVLYGGVRNRYVSGSYTSVDVTTIYWHFMDLLWIYLFILLFVWR